MFWLEFPQKWPSNVKKLENCMFGFLFITGRENVDVNCTRVTGLLSYAALRVA